MARWEPNAGDRLAAAALELYVERGFDQTTVAAIAERAGLTARTFFRYYADKREVLFSGAAEMERRLVQALAAAPADVPPMAAAVAALNDAATPFSGNQQFARRRYGVIAANAELHERELIKMAALSTALVAGLRDRGVAEVEASLVAEAAVAIFRVSFERWVGPAEDREFAVIMRDALEQLRALTAT